MMERGEERLLHQKTSYEKQSKEITGVVRRLLLVSVIAAAGVCLFVFSIKNNGSSRTNTKVDYKWVGEWVVEGQDCNGPRYRIRLSNFAAPGRNLEKLNIKPIRKNDSASFRLNDGSRIDLIVNDRNHLELISSVHQKETLVRCLNPFRTKRSGTD